MKAELLKVRYLPLPRWTVVAAIGITLLAGVVLLAFPPSDPAAYIETPSHFVNLAAWVAALVFGVWLATLDVTAGTVQRTLVAEPRRSRVLAAKLVISLAFGALLGLSVAAAAVGLAELAANHAGETIDEGALSAAFFGQVPETIAAAALGFAFGLITLSLGGGISLGILFILVLGGLLSVIPGLEAITYSQLTQDLSNGLTDVGETRNSLPVALIGTIAWCAAVIVPGWLRFLRSDLK